jgi:hypothetical protein
MGISPDDLRQAAPARPPAPTFAEYIPVVSAAVTAGTRRVYGSYWNRVAAQWGDRRLDEPDPSEIKQLAECTKTHVVARRNARGGRNAAGHLIQLGTHPGWVTRQPASFPALPGGAGDPIHRGHRAVVAARIEFPGPDLRDRQVGVGGRVQQVQHLLTFGGAERSSSKSACAFPICPKPYGSFQIRLRFLVLPTQLL